MIFKNRADAGRKLAEKLAGCVDADGVILAIPRGGAIVGAEIAGEFGLVLDLIIPRKIGSPQNPEVAIGAVTQDGSTILDQRLIELLRVSELELKDIIAGEIKEIDRRMALYGAGKDRENYVGRQLVVVDDGVATGYTMLAALRSVRNLSPKELILAIPVAPPDTLELLKKEADRTICLFTPDHFYAVGQFYENFEQTADEEVVNVLMKLKDK